MKKLALKKCSGNKKRLSLRKSINNPRGEDDKFPYLRFKRHGEKISRVDRYSITLYWEDFDVEGNPIICSELFFYPSDFGMNEIESFTFEDVNTKYLSHRLNQLKQYGNCWWRTDTNQVLTPDNWILDRSKIIDYIATEQHYGYKHPTMAAALFKKPNLDKKKNKKLKLKSSKSKLKLKVKTKRLKLRKQK